MRLILRFAACASALAGATAVLTWGVTSLPVGMPTASAVALNAAQAVALLAFPAAALVLAKWGKFNRKDYAASFFLALYAMVLMQVPVQIGGMTGWSAELVLLSGVARWLLYISAALFARAMLKDECPWWGWLAVAGTALAMTALL